MLKESLEHMLETGEPRMHEPAFEPSPDEYVGWDYARGYLDSLTEADADEMEAPAATPVPAGGVVWVGDRSRCAYCRARLPQKAWSEWSYCPFCNAALAPLRLVDALAGRGWGEAEIAQIMDDCGFEPPLEKGETP